MRYLGRIALLSAIVMMMVACGSKQGKIIPRGRFAQLYASLFEADAWLEYHSESRFTADTTNFYMPVLKSYGYAPEDFRRSVDHYLKDPGRYAKILEEATEILQKQVDDIQAIVDSRNRVEVYVNTGRRVARQQVMFDTLIARAGFTDKVDLSMDEYGRYVFNRVLEDTSFFGPRLIIAEKDTVATALDSLDLPARPGRLQTIDMWKEECRELISKARSAEEGNDENQESSSDVQVNTLPKNQETAPPAPKTRPMTAKRNLREANQL